MVLGDVWETLMCREEVIINVSLFSENKLKTRIKTGQQDSKEELSER